ncbi:hypothetical protein D3C86_426440 [compost metagenome]
MLMKAWKPIHTPTPWATRPENTRSSAIAWRPMCMMRRVSHRNRPMISSTPMRPNSSPITASRKSVCASGSQCSFSTLPPRPTPKTSPRPMAISECDSW